MAVFVRYAAATLLAIAWCAPGCHGKERPGRKAAPPASAPDPGPSAPHPVGPATEADAGAAVRDASGERVAPDEWLAPFDVPDAGLVPSGANWGRCALHFKPRAEPGLDATRLGLMCGPSNGMERVPVKPRQLDGGTGIELDFQAKANDCVRLVIVGGAGTGSISARLLEAGGNTLARQTGHRRWTMLGLDGPVCLPRDGRYRATVRADGALAVELWRLR